MFVHSVRIVQSDVFEQQEIKFSPVTCIVGSHGTGKTLLLSLLEAIFGYSGNQQPPFVGKSGHSWEEIEPVTGSFEVSVSSQGEAITQVIDLSASDKERGKLWADGITEEHALAFLSSARVAIHWVGFFQELPFVLRNSFKDSKRYKRSELSAIRNILGRSYESVTVQTLLSDSEPNDYFEHLAPYVTVSENGRIIDSTKLSLGELWVHQVFWGQDKLAPGCLFLLDEPESFLAVRGHRPFIDEVARRCLDRKLQLVVATHSPEMLSRFLVQDIRVCSRGPSGKIRVVHPESLAQIHRSVGIEIPTKTLVLVEDVFAADILRAIFGQLNVPMGTIEVVSAGGKDAVIAGVRALVNAQRIRYFGVLDADQKSQIKDERNLRTLPGSGEPETELLKVASTQPHDVAELLGRSPNALLLALEDCEFLDHQYQPRKFAQNLGLDQGFVVSVLVGVWLRDSTIKEEAKKLTSELGGE
jgi:ABC-type molybdenum transport system ATPase subunit/photorepair protein PhrA